VSYSGSKEAGLACDRTINTRVGAVVIGRNEDERLKACILSLIHSVALIVYVDSGSTDGSVLLAREIGADVVELDTTLPFTAARARNAGFQRLRLLASQLTYVQFVDGDCEVNEQWLWMATNFLDQNKEAAVVCGRRRERFPHKSIYNQLCDAEWNTPVGQAKACGGDALMRTDAVDQIGGYREDLIAGEEPELCVRLRADGWQIWRLNAEMTLHDAAMTRLSQWWRRTVRSGYAFAQGAALHGRPPERHWVWESGRALLWAICLPLTILAFVFLFGGWTWLLLLIYPAQIVKQILRSDGATGHRILIGFFQVLARFPEAWGQILYFRDRLIARQRQLIEYK
jgi:cellulose synthase/poly-beta-1,6-N-acetylglucosamine synthase-like glycosyltransferase